ncbi:unnamed protein product [Trypanosoma congolense IL3000]|uniref:WGS project CAEQ00000000 data, annotated contig 1259 n=1 Tax=Trypanosoma congolense (strain IL3000) TaxID=1068625 RepID=F9W505_TRYCI|nr:unnamed protein product [Trypanosoma congolense IL3000]
MLRFVVEKHCFSLTNYSLLLLLLLVYLSFFVVFLFRCDYIVAIVLQNLIGLLTSRPAPRSDTPNLLAPPHSQQTSPSFLSSFLTARNKSDEFVTVPLCCELSPVTCSDQQRLQSCTCDELVIMDRIVAKGLSVTVSPVGVHYSVLLLVAFFTLVSGCRGDSIELVRRVITVAGKYGLTGHDDGPPGTSTLSAPHAICRGRSNEEILVGTVDRFRSFSRSTNKTSTVPNWGNIKNLNNSGLDVGVDKPRSCVRWMSGEATVIYFVEGLGDLKYFSGSSVSSLHVVNNGSLTAVALYENRLYLTEQNMNNLWVCKLSGNGVPEECNDKLISQDKCGGNIVGVTVTSQGIFTVGHTALDVGTICWFDMNGRKISESKDKYVDISSTDSGTLYAASKTELYHVTAGDASLTAESFAGGGTGLCLSDGEGDDINLCENSRLLVIAEYEMYVASVEKNTLRAIVLPPIHVRGVFPGRPLPVGYPEEYIMEWVAGNLTKDVNSALKTTDSLVNVTSVNVDQESWVSTFTVIVQQADFDSINTEQDLQKANYTHTTNVVDTYYNLTNELVYMDSTLVNYCNTTLLHALRRKVAQKVGETLNFDLIYADMPIRADINGTENITTMKLLMPASFNNNTTPELLSNASLTGYAHSVIRDLRHTDTRVNITFLEPPFLFSGLSPEKEQNVRWYIHEKVMSQLEMCKEMQRKNVVAPLTAAANDTKTYDNEANVSSSCQSTITNRTTTTLPRPPYNEKNEYEVFSPEEYDFNVSRCVDNIDWGELEDYLNGTQVTPAGKVSRCGQGCIIALAVVCAVIAAILIALLVVLTSKRRRLAAVVAPPRRKFMSTLDEEELEYAATYGGNGGGGTARRGV